MGAHRFQALNMPTKLRQEGSMSLFLTSSFFLFGGQTGCLGHIYLVIRGIIIAIINKWDHDLLLYSMCYGLNRDPNKICWSPSTQDLRIWRAFKEVIKVKWGPFRWSLIQSDWCPYGKHRHTEKHQGCTNREERPCEVTVKRRPPAHPGGRPQKPPLLAPWSWTYSLQNCETLHFCCLSHPVLVTLL